MTTHISTINDDSSVKLTHLVYLEHLLLKECTQPPFPDKEFARHQYFILEANIPTEFIELKNAPCEFSLYLNGRKEGVSKNKILSFDNPEFDLLKSVARGLANEQFAQMKVDDSKTLNLGRIDFVVIKMDRPLALETERSLMYAELKVHNIM